MPDKVTLWKASNGMHYATQGEAEMAEAEAELRAFITSQAGGGDPALRDTIVRLCLGVWDGMAPARPEIEERVAIDPSGEGRGSKGRTVTRERGAAVFARYAAAIVKHAEGLPAATGSRAEADAAGREVEAVQVVEPVRRRAIRSGREPATPEGDRPGRPVDFDSLPRPRRSVE